MTILDYIRLLRPQQWYKNLVVFLVLIFSNFLFRVDLFFLMLLGFISLCFISSANYIINDILDVRNDRRHPEKRTRPLASGNANVYAALAIALILAFISTTIAYALSPYFFYGVLFLLVSTTFYSLVLKNEPILDIIIIAINFAVRTTIGIFMINAINEPISPWLVLCPFFLALFLAIGKRKSDLELLGDDAFSHKEVLKYYTKSLTDSLLIISTTLLLIAYSLFAFLSEHKHLLISLPFAVYSVFRYVQLTYSGSEIARRPELVIKDWKLSLGVISWFLAVIAIIYLLPSI